MRSVETGETEGGAAMAGRASDTGPRTQAPRILVIDDMSARDALRVLLCEEGYEVLTAPDGPAALALFDTFAPDLVLADARSLNLDAAALSHAARAHAARPAMVLMSAWGRGAVPEDALFVAKPIELDRLLVVLEEALAARAEAAGR